MTKETVLASAHPDLPDYDALATALYGEHIDLSAAEVHGMLTGIAASPDSAGVDWAGLVLDQGDAPGTALSDSLRKGLEGLLREATEALRSEQFGLKLVLPDAGGAMAERVAALADWCRGFIMGLAAGGLGATTRVSEEAAEAIADLMYIGEATGEDEAEGEEQERDLAELEEYVRTAVTLLAEESRRKPVVH